MLPILGATDQVAVTRTVMLQYAAPVRIGSFADLLPVVVVGVGVLLLATALVIVAVRARAGVLDRHDDGRGRH